MCYSLVMQTRFYLPLLMLALAGSAEADIYKHIDEHGNITFTNTPIKGAQRILIEPSRAAIRPAAKPSAVTERAATTPHSFPRVDADTQKERDINRRHILEEELSSEQRLLSERKKELTNAEIMRTTEEQNSPKKYVERLGRLRESLLLHEKNISALQSELAKLR